MNTYDRGGHPEGCTSEPDCEDRELKLVDDVLDFAKRHFAKYSTRLIRSFEQSDADEFTLIFSTRGGETAAEKIAELLFSLGEIEEAICVGREVTL